MSGGGNGLGEDYCTFVLGVSFLSVHHAVCCISGGERHNDVFIVNIVQVPFT